jgi:hypothetical protein
MQHRARRPCLTFEQHRQGHVLGVHVSSDAVEPAPAGAGAVDVGLDVGCKLNVSEKHESSSSEFSFKL